MLVTSGLMARHDQEQWKNAFLEHSSPSLSLACENGEEHKFFFFKTVLKTVWLNKFILGNKHVSNPGNGEGIRGTEKLDRTDTELCDVRWAMSHRF